MSAGSLNLGIDIAFESWRRFGFVAGLLSILDWHGELKYAGCTTVCRVEWS
jgi:hypothetical protein